MKWNEALAKASEILSAVPNTLELRNVLWEISRHAEQIEALIDSVERVAYDEGRRSADRCHLDL